MVIVVALVVVVVVIVVIAAATAVVAVAVVLSGLSRRFVRYWLLILLGHLTLKRSYARSARALW